MYVDWSKHSGNEKPHLKKNLLLLTASLPRIQHLQEFAPIADH